MRSLSRRNISDTALGVIPANSSNSPFSSKQFPMSAAPIIVKDYREREMREGEREMREGKLNHSLHCGTYLSSSCLSISEDADVVAIYDGLHEMLGVSEHVGLRVALRHGTAEHLVEVEVLLAARLSP